MKIKKCKNQLKNLSELLENSYSLQVDENEEIVWLISPKGEKIIGSNSINNEKREYAVNSKGEITAIFL